MARAEQRGAAQWEALSQKVPEEDWITYAGEGGQDSPRRCMHRVGTQRWGCQRGLVPAVPEEGGCAALGGQAGST